MVHNHFIKCQVCGSIIRIRLQVGFLKQHPIIVTCGKCKASLCGKVYIDQEKLGLKMEFDNADSLDFHGITEGDYFVECSGEFPVRKQGEDDFSNLFSISPFITHMAKMGNKIDNIRNYQRILAILNTTSDKWKSYKRILDLYECDSPYLKQEIKKVFDESIFPCESETDIHNTIHAIEVLGFCSALKPQIADNSSFFDDVLRLDPSQIKQLITFLDSHDGYNISQMQSQIYKILDEFILFYPALIPAISLQFSGESDFDFEHNGTTTSTFETVKQFYLDVYETLGNLMVVPVAFNNIFYRGDVNSSDSSAANTCTLENYIKLTKANRYHLCTDTEKFTAFLDLKYNAKLRNAIGHNDIEYDTATQLITFYPNPQNRSIKGTEYLLQFELEALHMFQGILVLSEYLFLLKKLKLIQAGNTDLIEEIASQIGTYDLCPCGSGKKYKFCHKKK